MLPIFLERILALDSGGNAVHFSERLMFFD